MGFFHFKEVYDVHKYHKISLTCTVGAVEHCSKNENSTKIHILGVF